MKLAFCNKQNSIHYFHAFCLKRSTWDALLCLLSLYFTFSSFTFVGFLFFNIKFIVFHFAFIFIRFSMCMYESVQHFHLFLWNFLSANQILRYIAKNLMLSIVIVEMMTHLFLESNYLIFKFGYKLTTCKKLYSVVITRHSKQIDRLVDQ